MTEREKFVFSTSDGEKIVVGDDERFEIILVELYEKRRWDTTKKIIVKRKSDGKYFVTYYCVGNTEYQEIDMFYEKAEFIEVFETTKTVVVYE